MHNVIRIRKQIDEKVMRQRNEDRVDDRGDDEPVEQFKIKLSTRATNPEGLLELEIKEREQRD